MPPPFQGGGATFGIGTVVAARPFWIVIAFEPTMAPLTT